MVVPRIIMLTPAEGMPRRRDENVLWTIPLIIMEEKAPIPPLGMEVRIV